MGGVKTFQFGKGVGEGHHGVFGDAFFDGWRNSFPREVEFGDVFFVRGRGFLHHVPDPDGADQAGDGGVGALVRNGGG